MHRVKKAKPGHYEILENGLQIGVSFTTKDAAENYCWMQDYPVKEKRAFRLAMLLIAAASHFISKTQAKNPAQLEICVGIKNLHQLSKQEEIPNPRLLAILLSYLEHWGVRA